MEVRLELNTYIQDFVEYIPREVLPSILQELILEGIQARRALAGKQLKVVDSVTTTNEGLVEAISRIEIQLAKLSNVGIPTQPICVKPSSCVSETPEESKEENTKEVQVELSYEQIDFESIGDIEDDDFLDDDDFLR